MGKEKFFLAVATALAVGLMVALGGCASAEPPPVVYEVPPAAGVAVVPEGEFHVFIAFGQSNMVGYLGPPIGTHGNSGGSTAWVSANGFHTPPSNFFVMAAANNERLPYGRQLGQWYPAVPPLVRAGNGLSPADFFGRTIAEAVAGQGINVGVIVVAIDGVQINMFSPDMDGFVNYMNSRVDQVWEREQGHAYVDMTVPFPIPTTPFVTTDTPYQRIVNLARQAQQQGAVIKGIIMHQGESGIQAGTGVYNEFVRMIYDSLIADLGLVAGEVPFLAGEPVREDSLNIELIRSIPQAFTDLPNTAFVISSEGLEGWEPGSQEDWGNRRIHFSLAGYEELGRRYAQKMLDLLYR